jgi:hypothetical protein
VLDTAGVLPGRSGTFRLWFIARPASDGSPPVVAPPPPRLVVVADGRLVIAETIADLRLAVPPTEGERRVFERDPLAWVARGVPQRTAEPRVVFGFAAGLAALLSVIAGGGTVAAFRAAAGRPPAYGAPRPPGHP